MYKYVTPALAAVSLVTLAACSGTTAEAETATATDVATTEAAPILQAAKDLCAPAATSARIGDRGMSLTLDGEGQESSGLKLDRIVCVLDHVEMPDHVMSRIEGTRALDGVQDAEWGDLTMTWSYHPDDGLDVILVETSEN